jgi:hypothetical protein
MTFFDFATKAEAVAFAKDEDKSLRSQDEYTWRTRDWFYTANILAVIAEPQGDTLIGFRHFCMEEEEVRKECKERNIDVDSAMAEREEVRAGWESGIVFRCKFTLT